MLILTTDRVGALIYQYQTLFEQSDKLIRIAAENFDVNGNILQGSQIVTKADMNLIASGVYGEDGSLMAGAGLITKSNMVGMFVIGANGTLQSVIGASAEGVTIKAASITLEGLVTANQNFKILADGSMEAVNAKLSGTITAIAGDIGYFSINAEGLYYGDPTKWGDSTYKQNLASITPGLIRLQRQVGAFTAGDVANIKVGIGDGADPALSGLSKSCYSAGYFYRQMNPYAGDFYTPAVKIISDNVINRDVALYVKGAIVCHGGLIAAGHFNNADSVTVLDFSFGTTILISNTAYRNVYLPKLAVMRQLMSITDTTKKFAVPVRLVAQYTNSANIVVCFQDSETTVYFRNYNGGSQGQTIEMGAGDILELLMVWDGTNYYAQLLDKNS